MTAQIYSIRGKRVFVAGHRGMVGAAILRRLDREGCEVLTAERATLDLRNADAVELFLKEHRPHAVFVAAAKVGGIYANSTYPVEFLMENLAIAQNTIGASFKAGVEKLLFLGSSCIYPRLAPQPVKEEYLLTGALEPTNEWYALAKIAGIKMCEAYRREYGADFISVMPTNLYGPGDNFHPDHSHVPAALIQRFHQAKWQGQTSVTVWGTGEPRREFLFVDDMADACIFVMQHYSAPEFLNVGTGKDLTIREFAEQVQDVVGFDGALEFDSSKPDGAPRKLLDTSKLTALGWSARTSLRDGLSNTYAWFVNNVTGLRAA